MTFQDATVLAPFIAAILVALAILTVDFIFPGRKVPALVATFAGLALVAVLVVITGQSTFEAFGGAYDVDPLTTFLDLLFISIVAFTMAFAPDYLEERGLPVPEFAALLVFAMSGAMLLAASGDLLILFLGLELMVLPGYVLAGYHKSDGYSTEGAIKYFLLGSFSSAIFLFGLAFVWGITGTTNIAEVAGYMGQVAAGAIPMSPGLGLALAFMTTGVAFKIAAVPFHYWTPDAYQGSPTPVTGYLSVGPKIAAFALIIRLFAEGLAGSRDRLEHRVHGPRGPDDDPGQPGRAPAGQRQAHAGLLVHRPHRLHAGRVRGLRRREHRGHGGAAVLRRRVRVHEPRRVRRRGRPPATDRCHQQPVDVRGARPPRAGDGLAADALPAEPDRHPADGRLLRQVPRDLGRGRGRGSR